MTRILIADDHAAIRMGVSGMIKEMQGFMVTAEAASGAEVLAKIQQHSIDLVIMDISMPGRTGLETLEDLRRLRRKPAVLIYTMHPEDDLAVRAVKLGASGYLTKASPALEMIKAIVTIAGGGKYITAALGQQLAAYVEFPGSQPLYQTLSVREAAVMHLIVEGKSLIQIAHEFGVSASTVTSYRSRIMEKMRMKTNAELIRYWISVQAVPAPSAAAE